MPDEGPLTNILTNLPDSDRQMLTRIVERWGSLSDELKKAVLSEKNKNKQNLAFICLVQGLSKFCHLFFLFPKGIQIVFCNLDGGDLYILTGKCFALMDFMENFDG